MRRPVAVAVALLAAACASDGRRPAVPARPELLALPPARFSPPDPAGLRFTLSNGIPVYAMEDHGLPLVTVAVLLRGGSSLEPEGREGLTELMAALWPAGGAGDLDAAALDDRLDRLAAELEVKVGPTSSSVTLDVLAAGLEPAVGLLGDVLRRPRWQADRLEQARADLMQELRGRNDDPAGVEAREWRRLLYGPAAWLNRLPTATSVGAVTADDCRALRAALVGANTVVVAVAGDFDRAALPAMLEVALGDVAPVDLPPPPPPLAAAAAPGVWLLDRPEMEQARVRAGCRGVRRGDPDELPLAALAELLGGSFTSRLVRAIRSEAGLAYDVSAWLTLPADWVGTLNVAFQTRAGTCAHGVALVAAELRDLCRREVSPAELETARTHLLARARDRFGSARSTVLTLATDELEGRAHDYWPRWRARVEALTAAELRAAAARHLDPARLTLLVLGDRAAVAAGDPGHEARLDDLGPVHLLPDRDPLTLAPLAGSE